MESSYLGNYGPRRIVGMQFPVSIHRFLKGKAGLEGTTLVTLFIELLVMGIGAKYGIDAQQGLEQNPGTAAE